MEVCREMVSRQGLRALQMRSVAAECHIALGSLYNYFPSKEALVTETIESVWQSIFRMDPGGARRSSFPEYLTWMYERLRQGTGAYPNFLTAHSISLTGAGKSHARAAMDKYLVHMKRAMIQVLEEDGRVREGAFGRGLTARELVDFAMDSMITLLLQQREDCRVLTEVISRAIYGT